MTDAAAPTTAGDYDRHAATFPVGAPDVGFGGVDVWRVSVTLRNDLDDDPEPDSSIGWTISSLTAGQDDTSLVLMGDLVCTKGNWFAGCTVSSQIEFRPGSEPELSDDAVHASMTESLGGWGSSVMYDVAASLLRAQVALIPQCQIVLPLLTPRPEIRGPRIAASDSPSATSIE